MKKFSGVGRGLFIQSNAADSEVGRVSPSTVENQLSSQSPPKPDLYEGVTIGKDGSTSEPSVLPQDTGDFTKDEEGKDIPQNSGCEPPDQDSSMPALDDNAKSKGPEASAKMESARISSLEDHPKVDSDTWKSEPSALSYQDKSPECVEPDTSTEVPLKDTVESVTDPTPSTAEGNIHIKSEFIIKTEEVKESNEISESSNTQVVANENSSIEPKSGEDTKDNENESTNESDPSVNEKSKIHIAANLNSSAPTSKGSKTTPDIPLLPSPVKVPGAGILGAAPNAPLLPRGPPSMFPKALPISIPPPPMDLRLPPPKKVPKTKEELLQILTEQVGLIQPLDEKGAADQGRGKTAPPADDQKSKAQPKKQQYPQRQQQHQQYLPHQPGQPWQNPGRENNWRQKTDGKGQQNNMRMPQQGMTNMQNRQPNASGKKTSPQGTMKSGLSSLTKDELEKEYQWQKFSVERKIKKILKSLKTSTNEEVIKELLAIIKFNPSKLANFPWPKEQYVVLEKLIEHAIVNTDNDDALHKRIATIINSLQDMHPQGFKEDLKNAIMHEQGEYIQGSSSDFRRKQARSASHFLGELYNLSRVSSTEFKTSVQSVIALTLKDWIKAPNVTSTSEDSRLLLEVNSECLEEFLILTLRDNDENIKKQVLTLMKEEVLSTTRPKEARTLLLDTLFKLACQRCTAGIPTTAHVNQDKRDAKPDSGLSDTSPAKVTSSSPQLPISPQKPNNQQDGKWATQQQQQRQQQQKTQFPGPRFTSPPPSGLAPVPRRLPPGQHPMSFPQGHPVNTSVPPPSINQPGHNIPRFPPQGPPPVPVPMSAAATSSGLVMNQLPQQTQHQHQQHGYSNQITPASMQVPQGSHPTPQSQISQGGSQRHSHGLAATLAMVQQGAISDPQAVATQQILGNAVHQAANIPPSQASSMPSMMYANSQVNPHSVSGVTGQQMMQDGNIQAGTAHGHTVQSSQLLRNIQVSLAQQMSTSLSYQQQEELVNQLGHIGLSGSSPWQRSGICVTQAVTTPLSSTTQGMNPSLNRQDMLAASPGIPGIPSSQGGMSSQPPFTQSAGSGTFVDNIPPLTPNQDFKQNSNDVRQGIGQWGMPAQDSPWSEKLLDSNQLPTSPPPSFTSPLQTPNQWSGDSQGVTSQEADNDTPQEPSGWGDGSPGPQESSQQRLGTDGWGTSTPSQGIASWGANPLPGNPKTTDGWNGHVKSVPGHQSGQAQQISAERPEVGSRGFPSQPRMPNQAPQNVSQTPSKNMYNFEESASSDGSEYVRSGAYTLPSRHKEGSPAAEGVSYSAMSELGSYGIGPGNSFENTSYGGAYTPIRDGGGYGDHLPPGAQKVDGYVLLPESKPIQESNSPEPVDFKAIRNCVVEEDDDLSIYERNAHENQLRNREQYGQPDWAKFGAPKDKHVPSPFTGRNRRENIHRGQGRGSLRVTNPCTAMPPFPAAHPPGSNLPPFKQNFSPRN